MIVFTTRVFLNCLPKRLEWGHLVSCLHNSLFAESQAWYHGWVFNFWFSRWLDCCGHFGSLRIRCICTQHWDCETSPANCSRSSSWVSCVTNFVLLNLFSQLFPFIYTLYFSVFGVKFTKDLDDIDDITNYINHK